jgi:hypothetical protein
MIARVTAAQKPILGAGNPSGSKCAVSNAVYIVFIIDAISEPRKTEKRYNR